jgi:hypothetical protein
MRIRNLLAVALLCVACEPAPPQGQFGTYPKHTKQLRLASGDTFTVYRVKHWTFNDGTPPALQLEYEPPFSVDDTVRLRHLAYRIWPAFAPYVEKVGLTGAILTATNLRTKRSGLASASRVQSYGLIVHRDSLGIWRIVGDPSPLPPAETMGEPRIFEASGDPLLMKLPR